MTNTINTITGKKSQRIFRLWRDESKEADQLERELIEEGYNIERVISFFAKPAAEYRGLVHFGYAGIRRAFLHLENNKHFNIDFISVN